MTMRPAHDRIRFWLEAPGGAVAATWFRPPPGSTTSIAVVVVPGIAHEDRTTSTGLAAIGEACTNVGMHALLFDLEGTAQSTGNLESEGIVAHWLDDVRVAVDHARGLGFEHVVVVGVRTGALVSVVALQDHPVDAMVLWSPITSGRRYGRELRLLQNVSNEAVSTAMATDPTADIEIAGFTIPADVIHSLRTLELAKITSAPAPTMLIIDAPESDHADAAKHLRDIGATVDELTGPQTDAWVNRATDGSAIPEADIDTVVRWVREAAGTARPTAPPALDPRDFPSSRLVEHQGEVIRETLWMVGSGALCGVWSEPADADRARPGAAVCVLVPAVGPGRSFVQFARGQAVLGRSSLRLDISGFGTSPRRPDQPWSIYYSSVGSSDIHEAIDEVSRRGCRRIVIIGFCATAWSALQASNRPEVVGAVALNVHLYVRDRPASILNGTGRTHLERAIDRRLPRNRRATLYHAIYRRLPLRGAALEWARRVVDRGARLIFIFDSHDDGLSYLRRRMTANWEARLADGTMRLRTYPALGHGLEGPTDRARMMTDLSDELAALDESV